MIELKGVSKKYTMGKNTVRVLDNINLKIEKGEFVGITGQSGSGKTTLSNIIAGLLLPTEGDVIIDGNNISGFNDRQMSEFRNKTLGFVFQSFNLINELTAIENVMLPLAYSKIRYKKREELGREALDRVGLSSRIYHRPTEMSGGQMQRVAIARAMVNNPRIIIADEPTGNLDTTSANTVIDIIKEINKSGVTVLMVTHNPEYNRHFSKIISLREGKLV